MARIVSTTTAGVPVDPTGGMTLDALMARQKALAEQGQQIAAPRQMTSPWQGAAAMAQQFVNARQGAAASDQLAAGRQELAKIRAGINLETGPTSEQISQASLLDPGYADNLTQLAAQAIQSRRAQELAVANREDQQQAAIDLQSNSQAFTGGQNDLTRAAAATAAATPKITDISGVRQDVLSDPSYKNMSQAVPIWASMKDAATRDTPQADLNMVVGLAKLLDPTSVVRQSETGAVELTGNLPAQLIGQYKFLTNKPGSRLDPGVRQGLLDEAYSRVKGYTDAYGKTSEWFTNLAKESNIDPNKVVPTFDDAGPYVPPAPNQPPPGSGSVSPGTAPMPLPSDMALMKPNVAYTFPDGRTGVWNGTGNIADQKMWTFTPGAGGGG